MEGRASAPSVPPHKAPASSQAPRRARKRVEGGASSNVFSMFDQSQIQEFKEVSHCHWGHGEIKAPQGQGEETQEQGALRGPGLASEPEDVSCSLWAAHSSLYLSLCLWGDLGQCLPLSEPQFPTLYMRAAGSQLCLLSWVVEGACAEVTKAAVGRGTAPGGRWQGDQAGPGMATQCRCLRQAFTIMDQNRDGFIDKEDLRDTFAALGGCPAAGEEWRLGWDKAQATRQLGRGACREGGVVSQGVQRRGPPGRWGGSQV